MFYTYDLLSPLMVRHALDFYEFADFEPGMMSNGLNPDKDNLEMTGAPSDEISNLIIDHIVNDGLFSERYCIQGVASPIFSLYKTDNQYHYHVDDWKTSYGRNDYSCTVFLSDPNDYDGGELEVQLGDVTKQFKLKQGQALLYPSSTIHRVNKVTSGERKALVFWCTSYITNPALREVIVALNEEMNKLPDNLKLKYIRNQLIRLGS